MGLFLMTRAGGGVVQLSTVRLDPWDRHSVGFFHMCEAPQHLGLGRKVRIVVFCKNVLFRFFFFLFTAGHERSRCELAFAPVGRGKMKAAVSEFTALLRYACASRKQIYTPQQTNITETTTVFLDNGKSVNAGSTHGPIWKDLDES